MDLNKLREPNWAPNTRPNFGPIIELTSEDEDSLGAELDTMDDDVFLNMGPTEQLSKPSKRSRTEAEDVEAGTSSRSANKTLRVGQIEIQELKNTGVSSRNIIKMVDSKDIMKQLTIGDSDDDEEVPTTTKNRSKLALSNEIIHLPWPNVNTDSKMQLTSGAEKKNTVAETSAAAKNRTSARESGSAKQHPSPGTSGRVVKRKVNSADRRRINRKKKSVKILNRSKTVTKVPQERVARTIKAGLIFPVGRVHRQMRRNYHGQRISSEAPVYLAGVMQYLVTEFLISAVEATRANDRKRITPRFIQLARQNDMDFEKMWENVTIPSAGVTVNIHKELLVGRPRKLTKVSNTVVDCVPDQIRENYCNADAAVAGPNRLIKSSNTKFRIPLKRPTTNTQWRVPTTTTNSALEGKYIV